MSDKGKTVRGKVVGWTAVDCYGQVAMRSRTTERAAREDARYMGDRPGLYRNGPFRVAAIVLPIHRTVRGKSATKRRA